MYSYSKIECIFVQIRLKRMIGILLEKSKISEILTYAVSAGLINQSCAHCISLKLLPQE